MAIIEKKYLKVLNASAGSGKTYNLVKDYIKVLLSKENDPNKFTSILAMTFTNLAALEMKERIISGLNNLANAEKEDNTKGLLSLLEEETELNKTEIIQSAKLILRSILHNYDQFSIMTIDKFNLKLIRSFSKELDLPIDFKIELDHKSYVGKIIEIMMGKIGEFGYEKMTALVLKYVQENLEDDEKWDFQKNLEKLANQLQKENYLEFFDIIEQKNYNEEEKQAIRQRLKEQENQFLLLADEAVLNLDPNYDQYPQKSGFTDIINLLPNGLEAFLSKGHKNFWKGIDHPKMPHNLNEVLRKIRSFCEENAQDYSFNLKYLRGFNNLALIKILITEIKKFKESEKIIQIAEFNKMISHLIQQESTPYIYEKLGTRYAHFLLDEFQDTSKLQWMNMLPLLHESASNGNFNLIVGDPKQSIYRFRNSDPKQFVDLLKAYQETGDEAHNNYPLKELGIDEELKQNWRSADEIVNFNNLLFEALRSGLPQDFSAYYKSLSQIAMANREGLVEFHVGDLEEEDRQQYQEKRILEIIDECVADGYNKSDICFLFAKNDIATQWAKFLRKNKHDVVSAESLLLFNDRKIRLTYLYLTIRQKPEDQNILQQFILMYFQLQGANSFSNYEMYEEVEEIERQKGKKIRFTDFVNAHFESTSNFFFRYENLYDLLQRFYQLMQWKETQNLELHQLADVVFEFENSNGPNLSLLNNFLESKKEKLAIQSPDRDNTIKIMTIHKSKGLEFPIVICPDFKFSKNNQSEYMLRKGDKVINTTLGKENPVFEIREKNEKENNLIQLDELNVSYVAFTRAEDRLYVLSLNNSTSTVVKQLQEFVKNHLEATLDEQGVSLLNRGGRMLNKRTRHELGNIFSPSSISDQLWFPDIALTKRKGQAALEISDEIGKGNQFHFVMSEINSFEEFAENEKQWLLDGSLANEFVEELRAMVKSTFEDQAFQNIFEGATSFLSEQAIITDEESSKRPDKVILKSHETIILDYKTGATNKKYNRQVMEYIQLFEQMKYPGVKGYLYYTESKTLEKINQ
ncbi:MAG: UvrD-helicase domain-containing protein [Bacteroidota bacterium]